MSRSWVTAPKADNCPTDLDPGFDRPQPDQSENRGADQDVQNREEVWVSSWRWDDEFQKMKGNTCDRDNLCIRGGEFSSSTGGNKTTY